MSKNIKGQYDIGDIEHSYIMEAANHADLRRQMAERQISADLKEVVEKVRKSVGAPKDWQYVAELTAFCSPERIAELQARMQQVPLASGPAPELAAVEDEPEDESTED